ncbi:MAG: ABC transporter ATP-binding protein, partial [Planctomycetes bacterium]|nr:ABC transporter ATP-binding protein [Planctomycetota bacterium]
MLGKIGTLWQLMRGQRLRYGAAVGAMVLSTFFMYLHPLVARGVIDYVIEGKELQAPTFLRQAVEKLGGRTVLGQNLWIAAIAVVLVTAIAGYFAYLKGRWSAMASESLCMRLRDRLYEHLQRLPCSYYDNTQTGDLVQRCTSDVSTIQMFLSVQVVEIARGLILMAGVLPILLLLNVRMTLLSVAIIPVILVFGAVFFSQIRSSFKRMDESEGRMTSRLQENITGARVVRAFARGQFECENFAQRNAEYRDLWYRLIRIISWYWPCSDLMCMTQTGLVLLVGANFVTRGELTIGTLYAFIAYINMFLWPVRHMGRILADLGKALVSLGRVQEILSAEAESDTTAADRGASAAPVRGEISFEHVSFSHNDDAEVLRDMSFHVNAGQTLAILGPSGAGKSTLIALLLRLYDHQAGAIRLDNVEIRDLPREYVRSQIGVVMQEPFLYSKTVGENIKLGSGNARDEEMVEVASAVCIHESVGEFEKGYDTLVGERGVTLSGGQRQRVALARAMLKNPPILVLDDALSS